jgi:hypothetical protein
MMHSFVLETTKYGRPVFGYIEQHLSKLVVSHHHHHHHHPANDRFRNRTRRPAA